MEGMVILCPLDVIIVSVALGQPVVAHDLLSQVEV